MIPFVFALAVLILVCVLTALLMDVAITRAGFPAESKPIAVVFVVLIGLYGLYHSGGHLPW